MRSFAFSKKYHLPIFLFLALGLFFVVAPRAAFAYEANNVLGQSASGNPSYTSNSIGGGPSGSEFNNPSDVAVDPSGHRLFVSDNSNGRVLVFNFSPTNGLVATSASYVFGQKNFGSGGYNVTGRNTLKNNSQSQIPLAYDPVSGRLFVGDESRVLVFDASTSTIGATTTYGENAEYVFGQPDFTSYGSVSTAPNNFSVVTGLTYDSASGRLFISDSNNNRVLVFDASTSTIGATTTYGENAEYVFGQPDFTSNDSSNDSELLPNDLNNPSGVAYDSASGRLFVSDTNNNRVLVFDASTSTIGIGATTTYGEDAEYVLGQTDFNSSNGGAAQNLFGGPGELFYDSASGRLFVSDSNNNRVLVFDASTSTIGIGATTTYGEDAEYVLGQTDFNSSDFATTRNSLNYPWGLSYDSTFGRLFVVDNYNNRVLGFDASTSTIGATTTYGEDAEYVLGQTDSNGNPSFTTGGIDNGPSASGFYNPSDVAIDPFGHRLFVADFKNNRVLVFGLDPTNSIASMSASYVFGQIDFKSNNSGLARNLFSGPDGVAYDPASGRLFVSDTNNNRVLVFDASTSTIGIGATTTYGEDAEYVLGQTDFDSSDPATTPNSLSAPGGLSYDPASGRLFVGDVGNNRVLVFDASTSTIGIGATTTYGEDAEYVLGQTSFSLKSSAATQNKFGNTSGSGPTGVAYDPTSSRLFVADNNNNRVLVFDASTSTIGATTTYGENAEYVLGQTSFSLKSSAATQSRFYHPYGLSYDPASGRLFVGDVGNNRVLVFDASTSTIGATTTYGENAEYVLGQTSFSLKSSAATQSGLSGPEGVVYDHALNRLFVADYGNNRVMEYSFVTVIDPELPDGTVDVPYSVAINTTSSQGAISYSFLSGSLPAGLLFATSTGLISGTPTAAASSSFAIEVTDYLSTEGTVSNIFDYSLAINPASASVPSSDSSSSVSSGSLVSSGSSVSTGGGGSAYDLSINSGATSTASASATLSLYGTGAYTMEVAETPDFSGSAWIPYVTSMPWTLATSTGEQTVYVKYRSISGSIVGSAQASIEFAALSASTTSSTSGMSIAQMEGLLASLEAQLQALEAQAGNQTASTTASLVFTRDLQLGMTGNDVKALQQFLISQNSGSAAQKLKTHGTTTNFGTLTQNALIEFQKKAGITPTSGYFGAITRKYLNSKGY